jgi:uncharacterized membrane protein YjjP (DUF1212 family)
MYVRQLLTHRQLHPQINFCITAFVATTVSGLLLRLPQFANTRRLPWPPACFCWCRAFR